MVDEQAAAVAKRPRADAVPAAAAAIPAEAGGVDRQRVGSILAAWLADRVQRTWRLDVDPWIPEEKPLEAEAAVAVFGAGIGDADSLVPFLDCAVLEVPEFYVRLFTRQTAEERRRMENASRIQPCGASVVQVASFEQLSPHLDHLLKAVGDKRVQEPVRDACMKIVLEQYARWMAAKAEGSSHSSANRDSSSTSTSTSRARPSSTSSSRDDGVEDDSYRSRVLSATLKYAAIIFKNRERKFVGTPSPLYEHNAEKLHRVLRSIVLQMPGEALAERAGEIMKCVMAPSILDQFVIDCDSEFFKKTLHVLDMEKPVLRVMAALPAAAWKLHLPMLFNVAVRNFDTGAQREEVLGIVLQKLTEMELTGTELLPHAWSIVHLAHVVKGNEERVDVVLGLLGRVEFEKPAPAGGEAAAAEEGQGAGGDGNLGLHKFWTRAKGALLEKDVQQALEALPQEFLVAQIPAILHAQRRDRRTEELLVIMRLLPAEAVVGPLVHELHALGPEQDTYASCDTRRSEALVCEFLLALAKQGGAAGSAEKGAVPTSPVDDSAKQLLVVALLGHLEHARATGLRKWVGEEEEEEGEQEEEEEGGDREEEEEEAEDDDDDNNSRKRRPGSLSKEGKRQLEQIETDPPAEPWLPAPARVLVEGVSGAKLAELWPFLEQKGLSSDHYRIRCNAVWLAAGFFQRGVIEEDAFVAALQAAVARERPREVLAAAEASAALADTERRAELLKPHISRVLAFIGSGAVPHQGVRIVREVLGVALVGKFVAEVLEMLRAQGSGGRPFRLPVHLKLLEFIDALPSDELLDHAEGLAALLRQGLSFYHHAIERAVIRILRKLPPKKLARYLPMIFDAMESCAYRCLDESDVMYPYKTVSYFDREVERVSDRARCLGKTTWSRHDPFHTHIHELDERYDFIDEEEPKPKGAWYEKETSF